MRTLIIVAKSEMAHRLQRDIDPTKEFFRVVSPGVILAGHRYDRVLIHPDADMALNGSPTFPLDMGLRQAQAWFREVVQCRLDVDGRIIWL